MRPLVPLFALLFLLALTACTSGSGPSSALEVEPAVGAGARVFAGPQDGVGAAARVDLGKYGFRTGKAAEPVSAPEVTAGDAAAACPGGVCPVPQPDPLRAPEAPTDVGSRK
jgi:hypothetical protein